MKKLIALLLCVCLLLSAAACTNAPAVGKSMDASNQDGEQRLRIVATLQSQQVSTSLPAAQIRPRPVMTQRFSIYCSTCSST